MTRHVLTVRGPLRGKGRPRSRKHGAGVYADPKDKPAENALRAAAMEAGLKPMDGFVRVRVVAVGRIPPSWTKRKRAEKLAAHYDDRKPDGSNVLKLVEDALNGIAWHDDVQCVDVACERRIDEGGERIIVSIEPARWRE